MSAAVASPRPSTLALELEPFVVRAAAGDAGAFARLVEASAQAVTSITLAICRDVAASEDLAQEVYLVAWRRLRELHNPSSFLPWVRQIARYTAKTWRRDRRSRARWVSGAGGSSDEGLDGAIERAVDPSLGPEDRLLDAEQDRVLREALDELPDEAREVLILFYREDRSSRQVASLLGLSDGAVRKRLERARRVLGEEVLRRVGRAVQSTAPGVAFAAAVAASVASAPVASAAGLGAAHVATDLVLGKIGGGSAAGSVVAGKAAAGKAAAGKSAGLAALVGGAGLGFLGGAAGVVFGLRRDFATITDARDRRSLHWIRALALAAVALATLGLVAPPLQTHWLGPVLVFAGLLAALFVLYMLWLPKILYRRFLREESGDEPAALRRLARRRRTAWIGFLAGAISGSAGLLAGLLSSGLL